MTGSSWHVFLNGLSHEQTYEFNCVFYLTKIAKLCFFDKVLSTSTTPCVMSSFIAFLCLAFSQNPQKNPQTGVHVSTEWCQVVSQRHRSTSGRLTSILQTGRDKRRKHHVAGKRHKCLLWNRWSRFRTAIRCFRNQKQPGDVTLLLFKLHYCHLIQICFVHQVFIILTLPSSKCNWC